MGGNGVFFASASCLGSKIHCIANFPPSEGCLLKELVVARWTEGSSQVGEGRGVSLAHLPR
mgnify:CR=1 FL=1